MKRVLLLLLTAALLLCTACAKNVEATPDTATVVEATQPPTYPPTEPPTELPTIDELAQAKYDQILNTELKNNFGIIDNVEPLGQLNGMQAGCEALALTAALNHFGYDLDIDDIVDDYMVYGNDFVTGYVGNPRRFYDGAGIYPPGMVTTVWNFVEDNDAPLYPFDTTGLSLDELYKFVDAGCPVLIWTTYDRYSPRIEQYREYEGVKYPWFDTEHCVCLHGYDLEDNEVKIADSWDYGKDEWEDAERFENVYDEIGRFSLVLMDTSKLR
ncbi:MAG: C39 family peptidase [Ruminococcus sp.]|nr:C39 family peptidase [Ruminococcus sp.]